MPEIKTFPVAEPAHRLDKFLVEALPALSRSYLQKRIKDGGVTVNGRPAAVGQRLVAGDEVAVTIPAFSSLPAAAADDVPVLHEDKELIVVNKPAGLVVHPAGPHQSDTLIQRLWPKLAPAWAKTVKGSSPHTARPGVVHRLDRGTSGVMVIAKTPAAAEALSAQFADRGVKKVYWALVEGNPGADSGVVRSNVGRDRKNPHRMSVSGPGKPSELEFKVLARFPPAAPRKRGSDMGQDRGAFTLMEVRPKTGRTHQIRVQLAALGHPLAGDATYGAGKGDRPLLHAHTLTFAHPRTGKAMTFTVPPPADFRGALRRLGWKGA